MVGHEAKTIARDVGFSLVFFAGAVGAGTVELPLFVGIGLTAVLIAACAYYVRRTLHSGGALVEVPERPTLWRFRSPPPTRSVVAQALRPRHAPPHPLRRRPAEVVGSVSGCFVASGLERPAPDPPTWWIDGQAKLIPGVRKMTSPYPLL